MDNRTYIDKAMITNDRKSVDRLNKKVDETMFCLSKIDYGQMVHAALGLAGESGEVSDLVKKHIFHEKKLDLEHLKKELGDVCWYIALMCDALETDFEEIMQLNIDKLSRRYTNEKFDVYQANNRSKDDI